jgi:hypothetical protein
MLRGRISGVAAAESDHHLYYIDFCEILALAKKNGDGASRYEETAGRA